MSNQGCAAFDAPELDGGEEARECVKALVACLRQAQMRGAGEQAEHMRQVVRVLSLSPAEVAAAAPGKREQLVSIRNGALMQMRIARGSQSAPQSPVLGPLAFGGRSAPIAIPGRPGSRGGGQASPAARSAPSSFCHRPSPPGDMAPPAFYIRKVPPGRG